MVGLIAACLMDIALITITGLCWGLVWQIILAGPCLIAGVIFGVLVQLWWDHLGKLA